MNARFTAAALAATLFAAPAGAGTLFALNNLTDELVTIDTDTLALDVVGALGTNVSFAGLAWDPVNAILYMVGGRGNENLYTVNTATGAATLVGNHGVRDLFAIAFDTMTGTLYGSQFSGGSGLYSLNTTSGGATTIDPAMERGIGGLTYDSTGDRLVGMNDGAGDLYEIDPANGDLTLLHNGPGINDSGLAHDPDKNLFWSVDYSGNLFSYDPANGFARTTELTGLGAFDGLAYVYGDVPPPPRIPLPFGLPLLATALGALGLVRLRR